MQVIYKIFLFFILTTLLSPVSAGSIISITNGNSGSITGFNDPTPFTSEGGNNATTLGQARLNAVQYAANKLSIKLNSNVRIDVFTFFTPKAGSPSGAVLAGTLINEHFDNFANAPIANTFYQVALAEKISGINLNDVPRFKYDLTIEINSDIDGNFALGPRNFYYGFDAQPPNNDVDFVTVLTHEIIHGIGFSTPVLTDRGFKLNEKNDTFMINLEHHGAIQPDYSLMTVAERVAAGISNKLHWIGAAILAKADVTSGFRNGHGVMHAPVIYNPGSSVSHFSPIFGTNNELMTPAYIAANHDIGFAAQVLEDVGWGKLNSNPNATDIGISIVDSGKEILPGLDENYLVEVSNNGISDATGLVITLFLPSKSVYVSATPANNGTCDTTNVIQNKIITCYLATLPPTGRAIFDIVVKYNAPGTHVFNANIESLNVDVLRTNNNVTEPTTVAFSKVQAPPVLVALNNLTVGIAETVRIIIKADDPNGDIPTLTGTNLPANSSFVDNGDGTAIFSWIPTSAGVVNMTFTATDGNVAYPNAIDTIPLQIIVESRSPTTHPTTNQSSGGGGCSLSSGSDFDPLFPFMLMLLSILYWTRRSPPKPINL